MKYSRSIFISIGFTIINSIVASIILTTTIIGFIYLVGKTENLGFIYTLLLVIFLECIFLFILWWERVYMKKNLNDMSLKSTCTIEVLCLFAGALTMNAMGILFFVYILPLSILNFNIKRTKSLIFTYCFNSILLLTIILLSMLLL
jgi:hypothetical protein